MFGPNFSMLQYTI